MSDFDFLQSFIFENHAIRGELVFLSESYQTVLTQRPYPLLVGCLVGEAMAATALLSGTIKYEGQLILQAQTDQAMNLLVVQCDHHLNIRALAKWQDDAHFSEPLLSQGQIVVTVSADKPSASYQGIINIESPSFSKNIENYFEQSEQLPTRLFLVANERQAVGMLLQKMPSQAIGESQSGEEWAYWEHVSILLGSLTETELLTLDAKTLLHRLYHEEDIRLYDPRPIQFACRCTEEKMWAALRLMEKSEIEDILKLNHTIDITCDFCNNVYVFSKEEVEKRL